MIISIKTWDVKESSVNLKNKDVFAATRLFKFHLHKIMVVHEHKQVDYATRIQSFMRILIFSTYTPYTVLMSHRSIYCAAVLSDVYSSVGYHDLTLNHVSV
jgi:hypothetical protein